MECSQLKPSLHDPLAQGTEARWLPTIWQHGILHLLQFLLTLPEEKKTSQAHCQGISKVQKVIGHTTKNITCIYRYYQDYLKYINFITQFLSLNMLMLRSCNHFFFTRAQLATYLFTHVVYDLYVFRVGQESWRVHSDVVMKSWHHV